MSVDRGDKNSKRQITVDKHRQRNGPTDTERQTDRRRLTEMMEKALHCKYLIALLYIVVLLESRKAFFGECAEEECPKGFVSVGLFTCLRTVEVEPRRLCADGSTKSQKETCHGEEDAKPYCDDSFTPVCLEGTDAPSNVPSLSFFSPTDRCFCSRTVTATRSRQCREGAKRIDEEEDTDDFHLASVLFPASTSLASLSHSSSHSARHETEKVDGLSLLKKDGKKKALSDARAQNFRCERDVEDEPIGVCNHGMVIDYHTNRCVAAKSVDAVCECPKGYKPHLSKKKCVAEERRRKEERGRSGMRPRGERSASRERTKVTTILGSGKRRLSSGTISLIPESGQKKKVEGMPKNKVAAVLNVESKKTKRGSTASVTELPSVGPLSSMSSAVESFLQRVEKENGIDSRSKQDSDSSSSSSIADSAYGPSRLDVVEMECTCPPSSISAIEFHRRTADTTAATDLSSSSPSSSSSLLLSPPDIPHPGHGACFQLEYHPLLLKCSNDLTINASTFDSHGDIIPLDSCKTTVVEDPEYFCEHGFQDTCSSIPTASSPSFSDEESAPSSPPLLSLPSLSLSHSFKDKEYHNSNGNASADDPRSTTSTASAADHLIIPSPQSVIRKITTGDNNAKREPTFGFGRLVNSKRCVCKRTEHRAANWRCRDGWHRLFEQEVHLPNARRPVCVGEETSQLICNKGELTETKSGKKCVYSLKVRKGTDLDAASEETSDTTESLGVSALA